MFKKRGSSAFLTLSVRPRRFINIFVILKADKLPSWVAIININILALALLIVVKFILKKFWYGAVVLFGVITTIFFLFNVLPGDPATVMLGQRASKAAIESVHKNLGTDKPILIQYLHYVNDLAPVSIHNYKNDQSLIYLNPEKYSWTPLFTLGSSGSKAVVLKVPYLRRSYITNRNVSEIIEDTLPETAVLAFAAILIASFFGIFLGIITATHKNSPLDRAIFVLATVFGMSAPSFLVGLIMAWLFGYVLSKYTGLDPSGSLYDIDVWKGEVLKVKNLVLPAITLGIRPLSIIIQLTRSSLLDVMSQDYIRTAKAKGLSYRKIILKHALKNALNPVVTAISGWFAGLMAGAVFVEKIFSWKGIGYEVVEALSKNDLPVVMGATLVFATIFVLINVIVDIVYGVLDPRVRVK
jgi:peptide/nickel transport system permease protein